MGADDCVQHTCVRFDPGQKLKGGLNDHDMEAPIQHLGKSLEMMVNPDSDVYCMLANKNTKTSRETEKTTTY